MYKFFKYNYNSLREKKKKLCKKQKEIYNTLTTGFYRKLATESIDLSFDNYLLVLDKKKFDINAIKFKYTNHYHKEYFPNFLMLIKDLTEINYEIAIIDSRLDDLKVRDIGRKEFGYIIERFNELLSEKIINGEHVSLGYGLGSFGVYNVTKLRYNPAKEKKYMDMKNSLIYRDYLVNKGLTPKSDLFPDGEEWKIYKEYKANYVWLKWTKGSAKKRNLSLYKLVPTDHLRDKFDDIVERVKTIKDVCLEKIGLVYKICIANKIDPHLRLKYKQKYVK